MAQRRLDSKIYGSIEITESVMPQIARLALVKYTATKPAQIPFRLAS